MKRGYNEFLEYIIKALDHEDKWVRWRAIKVLEKLDLKETLKYLIKAVEDEDDMVRNVAVQSLVSKGDHAVIQYLIKALKDKIWCVRRDAVKGLNKFVIDTYIDYILELSDDPDPRVREAVLEVIGNSSSIRAIDLLVRAMKVEYWYSPDSLTVHEGKITAIKDIPRAVAVTLRENYEGKNYCYESRRFTD